MVNIAGTAAPGLAKLAFTPAIINEGDSTVLTGALGGSVATDAATLLVDWGDGRTTTQNFTAGTTNFTLAHVYLDNPAGQPIGSFTATATLTDTVTAQSVAASAAVTVQNVAPAITRFTDASSASAKAAVGSPLGFTLTFTDPGVLDTHTVTVGWGDGSKAIKYEVAAGVLTFSPTHTYAKIGTFYVTVGLVDKDGAAAAGKATLAYVGPAQPLVLSSAQAAFAAPAATVPVDAIHVPAAAAAAAVVPVTPAPSSSGTQGAIGALALGNLAATIRLVQSSDITFGSDLEQVMRPAALVYDDADGSLRPHVPDLVLMAGTVFPDDADDADEDWLILPAAAAPHSHVT